VIKLLLFGDELNDMELFEVADECYAVQNANPRLKECATKVIESNNDDGVAKWFKENLLK